jgi:hypothetical protein
MKQLRLGALLCGAVLLTTAVLSAQAPAGGPPQGGAPAQPPLQNLQVLPKDMPRAQVIQIMQRFQLALGVNCGHCHVWTGTGVPTNDYATDTKPAKRIAREMLKMVNAANGLAGPAVQANAQRAAQQVTCAMCHRGKAVPEVEAALTTLPAPGGARPGGAPAGPPAPGGAPTPGRQ